MLTFVLQYLRAYPATQLVMVFYLGTVVKRIVYVNTGNTISRRTAIGVATKGNLNQDHTAVAAEDRYGLNEVEYNTFVQDCEESAQMCEDINYFLTNTPDVAQYLFY